MNINENATGKGSGSRKMGVSVHGRAGVLGRTIHKVVLMKLVFLKKYLIDEKDHIFLVYCTKIWFAAYVYL